MSQLNGNRDKGLPLLRLRRLSQGVRSTAIQQGDVSVTRRTRNHIRGPAKLQRLELLQRLEELRGLLHHHRLC